ncbi:hypothetical protein [Companilactobacillus mishanensis]|uniref:hypothetical protein n=1 Tax=Companilactobacillus mishanensis TaxID=2486008 RepID=UPI000F789533|nr:hypothetical protein [Companilactobacillus mishanensis]
MFGKKRLEQRLEDYEMMDVKTRNSQLEEIVLDLLEIEKVEMCALSDGGYTKMIPLCHTNGSDQEW